MNAYTRPRPLPTAADYERAHRAIMEEVDRLNTAWRNRPDWEKALGERYARWQPWKRNDDQFDVEREAEQQGITTRRYLRGL